MKITSRLIATIVIIAIAILTIAWIKYPSQNLAIINITKSQAVPPNIYNMYGIVVSVDNQKMIFRTNDGELIDIYNYAPLNRIISIKEGQHITFLVQSYKFYSKQQHKVIIGVITQGEKILLPTYLTYQKHHNFISYILSSNTLNSLMDKVNSFLKTI